MTLINPLRSVFAMGQRTSQVNAYKLQKKCGFEIFNFANLILLSEALRATTSRKAIAEPSVHFPFDGFSTVRSTDLAHKPPNPNGRPLFTSFVVAKFGGGVARGKTIAIVHFPVQCRVIVTPPNINTRITA